MLSFVKEASLSIRRHYEEVAGRLDGPVMIQDYETAGGVRLSAADLEAIAKASDNVRYVKVEGGDHLKRIREVTEVLGARMTVFGGMAGRYLLDELALGTGGSIPGAEMTDLLVSVYDAARRGHTKQARTIFKTLLPYLDFLIQHFDSFVAVEKEVLRMRGVIRGSAVREPGVPLDWTAVAKLKNLLEAMDLRGARPRPG